MSKHKKLKRRKHLKKKGRVGVPEKVETKHSQDPKHHYHDCVNKIQSYCKKRAKNQKAVDVCAKKICKWHVTKGNCAINTLHKRYSSRRR